MLTFNILVAVSLGYVAMLFAVAFAADRRARAGRGGWLRSPLIYTLSLSIYCTAWTFYGAVGYAARSGLEYLTIYLGPSLVVIGWWWLLRKLVRIARVQRITSIADLVSSRFGKSPWIGAVVTLIAVAGVTPYIALQLQSISLTFAAFIEGMDGGMDVDFVALWTAIGLALFTTLFGTRNLDPSERHHGIVMAVAVEAVVKLFALLGVGVFVVWGLGGGIAGTLARIDASPIPMWQGEGGRWVGLTALSAAAFLTLPRMFHVLVVENDDDRHLAVASWAFPLYVLLMSLFVVPIAVVGLERLPEGSNPDLFVLALPISEGHGGLALLAFLGGFSSATSMVIVATIALATMVSNHIVAPLWLSVRGPDEVARDLRGTILLARRVSVAAVLALGYVYFQYTGSGVALSSIGLIAFAGVAQILPAMLGGITWRGATAKGAGAGLLLGAAVWAWTLFLPSFGTAIIPQPVLDQGPWGLAWLRPRALFGIEGLDPLLHAVLWSLLLNAAAFGLVSILTFPNPLERLQGAQFVNVFDQTGPARTWSRSGAEVEDLLVLAQRVVGHETALDLFQAEAEEQGKSGHLPDATPGFLQRLERELAGSVGAAAAHALVGQFVQGPGLSVGDLMAVADEAAQILEYSARLEAKSAEQERTARALREANDKLTQLARQKDAFLSRISHELRTPMTSIRSFSSILQEEGLTPAEARRFAGIVEAEAHRMTRLLDDLLDLSVLRDGQVTLERQEGTLAEVIDRSLLSAGALKGDLAVLRDPAAEALPVVTDLDRLAQVFINLVSNARKYCDADRPELRIAVQRRGPQVIVDFVDNGSGIPAPEREVIFESFARLSGRRAGTVAPSGAGLGLAICREIMSLLGGSITYLPGQGGAAFRVTFPQGVAAAAAE
ncbi:ATP-binding protein [Rubellimicrobium roseum]|uniref:histidine kinase n=1 Tax=Rubellimicrobium roseum TaxID=687525 RepID=A0A5C4NNE3_9RHOB|nr:ATP-binding protein [Rubellimicrobium roseum]TNC73899.1 sodium:solute symporter [Rubellimicrobium roseum]